MENKFDGEKFNSTMLLDEMGQMPIRLRMNGCKFRWDAFKMAYEMSHPKSLERITATAEQIINWVNDEPKFIPKTE